MTVECETRVETYRHTKSVQELGLLSFWGTLALPVFILKFVITWQRSASIALKHYSQNATLRFSLNPKPHGSGRSAHTFFKGL